MTDHPPEPTPEPVHAPEPGPSEAEEAGVRRLLAQARHEGPVPADVAARLEAVLAGLREEQGTAVGAPRPAGVTDLGARRRRAGRLLVAAAAAVVAGIGVGVVHDHLGSLTGSGTAGSESAGSTAGGGSAGDSSAGAAASGARGPAHLPPSLGSPVRLTPAGFAEQVRLLRRDARATGSPGQRDGLGGPGTRSGRSPDGSTCVPGGLGRAVLVPVRYARDAGLLAFRPPVGDSQVVDLYLCGQDRPVRSVTLPAR